MSEYLLTGKKVYLVDVTCETLVFGWARHTYLPYGSSRSGSRLRATYTFFYRYPQSKAHATDSTRTLISCFVQLISFSLS